MEPVRVVFRLATPMVAPRHPIHLDALLAWSAVEAAGGDLNAQEDLPLERFQGEDGEWCWKASRVVPDVVHRTSMPMSRRFMLWDWAEDLDVRYEGGPKVLKPGTGPYKAYQMRFDLQQAPHAVAWAVGDPDRIRELLDRVSSLGKLARLGCGEIREVEVLPDPARENWKLRTLPVAVEGYRKTMATVRPPYWRRGARRVAWEPPADGVRQAAAEVLRASD